MGSATLEAREILEARYAAVVEVLVRPGSRARERGQLGITTFRSIAKKVGEAERSAALTTSAVQRAVGGEPGGLFCPQCGHEFRKTWGGIDAHWK